MSPRLASKTTAILGSTSGIGAAGVTEECATRGAAVVLSCRKPDPGRYAPEGRRRGIATDEGGFTTVTAVLVDGGMNI